MERSEMARRAGAAAHAAVTGATLLSEAEHGRLTSAYGDRRAVLLLTRDILEDAYRKIGQDLLAEA